MKRKTIKAKRSELQAVIHIGATKESITHVRESIMEILSCSGAGDPAKISAFETLRHFTEVKSATISHCNINVR